MKFEDCKPYDGRIFGAMGGVAIKPKDPKKQIKIDALMDNPRVVGQRKLNGERLEVYDTTQTGQVAYGRNTGTAGDRMGKTGLVPHLFKQLGHASVRGDIVLDGEVLFIPNEYSYENIRNLEFTEDFWKCREIMGKHKYPERGVAQQELEGYLHYFVFDLLVFEGKDLTGLTYEQRLGILTTITPAITTQNIHVLPVVYGSVMKRDLLQHCLDLGLEGIMLKYLTGTYHEGKKPANQWVKVKKHDLADCVIIGYSPAEQFTRVTLNGIKMNDHDGTPMLSVSRFYVNGWIGAMHVGQWRKGFPTIEQLRTAASFGYTIEQKVIDSVNYCLVPVAKVSGMTDALRAEISKCKNFFLGKVISVKYFEVTEDSYFHINFVEFRDDKPSDECIWTWN